MASFFHRYRHLGEMTTLVTFPDQLMPFRPGFSTGKSPDMWSFIKAVPRYASFREQSSTMPVVISVSSTIVVPIYPKRAG